MRHQSYHTCEQSHTRGVNDNRHSTKQPTGNPSAFLLVLELPLKPCNVKTSERKSRCWVSNNRSRYICARDSTVPKILNGGESILHNEIIMRFKAALPMPSNSAHEDTYTLYVRLRSSYCNLGQSNASKI